MDRQLSERSLRLRRARHVAWRRVGDETVLIHLHKKRIFVLNPAGGYFWHALDGTRDGSALVSELAFEPAASAAAAARVETFLHRLLEEDLVQLDEEHAARTPAELPEYPFDDFVPPELVWQEEIRNFGQSCAFVGGDGGVCNTLPTS